MKLGLIIGKFLPLHNGSLTLCRVAGNLSDQLVIVIINSPGDLIPIKLREKWLKQENPGAIVTRIVGKDASTFNDQLNNLLADFMVELSLKNIRLFSSDPLQFKLAKSLKIECTILDPNRLSQELISKVILKEPYQNWFDMPFSVRSSLIKRIVLIGPESVGKSTLAKKLKFSLIKHPFLPEYGRPYEIFRTPGPYMDHEFEEIIRVHACHREALLPFSGPVFIEDTDELATAVWVEMLLGKQLPKVENKIVLPFLYLLMDPCVPFVSEKTRYFNNEKRVDFFFKIKEKLNHYNASYVTIKGSWSAREKKSKKIIDKILSKKFNWSEISY